ncbi:MAG: UDP-N-acetylglucosamine 2-epimerase, partial [Phycisphaerales bacterium]|nr:UDP-N-acetylglucosamine 2-epimerase [Phycisphaerales bacterium]
VQPGKYAVITLHRPSNVDDAKNLSGIFDAFEQIAKDLALIFPMHPRTRKNIENLGLKDRVEKLTALKTPEPLGYLDFLKLTSEAALVLTDSGGIQEETTILRVPCLTLRENTERPVTITEGTNRLVSPNCDSILTAYREQMARGKGDSKTPQFWDGSAAERICAVFESLA